MSRCQDGYSICFNMWTTSDTIECYENRRQWTLNCLYEHTSVDLCDWACISVYEYKRPTWVRCVLCRVSCVYVCVCCVSLFSSPVCLPCALQAASHIADACCLHAAYNGSRLSKCNRSAFPSLYQNITTYFQWFSMTIYSIKQHNNTFTNPNSTL